MKNFRNLSFIIKIPVLTGIMGFAVFALVWFLLSIPLRVPSLNNSSR